MRDRERETRQSEREGDRRGERDELERDGGWGVGGRGDTERQTDRQTKTDRQAEKDRQKGD